MKLTKDNICSALIIAALSLLIYFLVDSFPKKRFVAPIESINQIDKPYIV